jgi:hypothetical protein
MNIHKNARLTPLRREEMVGPRLTVVTVLWRLSREGDGADRRRFITVVHRTVRNQRLLRQCMACSVTTELSYPPAVSILSN